MGHPSQTIESGKQGSKTRLFDTQGQWQRDMQEERLRRRDQGAESGLEIVAEQANFLSDFSRSSGHALPLTTARLGACVTYRRHSGKLV